MKAVAHQTEQSPLNPNPKMASARARIILPLLLGAVMLQNAAQAGTNTWIKLSGGDASGSWNTAANWSANALPGTTDTAVFSTVDTSITLDGNQSVNALIIGDTTTSNTANWILNTGTPTTSTLTLGGTTPTITVNDLGTGKAATIGAVLAGSTGLTKAGKGTLILAGANTYKGNTTIGSGTLQIGDGTNATANAGTGELAVGNNTLLLNFNGNATLANSLVTGGTNSGGLIQNNGKGKVTLNNSATFSLCATAGLNGGTAGIVLANQITSGSLNIAGDVTLSINNDNISLTTWASGTTLHLVGTNTAWSITGSGAGNPLNLDIASSLTLAQNGSGGTSYYKDLTGTGNFTYQGQSSAYGYVLGSSTLEGTLQVGTIAGNYCSGFSFGNGGTGGAAGATRIVANSTVTFNSTTDNTYSGIMSGTGGLIKMGANTLTLTGANTYTGNTTVNGGTLVIQHPVLSGNSVVTVGKGCVLQLDFQETNQVAGLVLNGVKQVPGVYNSTTGTPFIAGKGSLQVVASQP